MFESPREVWDSIVLDTQAPSSLENQESAENHLPFFRSLIWTCSIAYLLWWFVVRWMLPTAYNPFLGRFGVVATLWLLLWGSYRSHHVQRHIATYFSACIWLLTTHYFYLFYFNTHDINFVVGTYIVVLVVFTCFQSERSLLAYALFILFLASTLTLLTPHLRGTVFLPGLLTILAFSYWGLRDRLRLLRTTKESKQKILELFREVQEGEQNRILFEASQEALKIRDEFISIASHELKTPLTTIKLQTQMTLRKFQKDTSAGLGPEESRAIISQIDRQVDRLTRLVDDMLEMSRLSTAQPSIERKTFDLAALAQNTLAGLTHLVRQARSDVAYRGPQSLNILADRFRIEQVIVNLLTNALKYGQGKPILLSLEQSPQEVILSVQDQGLGIEKNQQARIFERFERAVSSRHISGLGLGLFISRQIVEAHQGKIEVVSEVGHGARFVVRLPYFLGEGT